MNAKSNSTSKKFNQMVESFETLGCEIGNRWFKVWWDFEGQEWVLQAGHNGTPANYTETHTDLAELEKSMRETASFRQWHFVNWA